MSMTTSSSKERFVVRVEGVEREFICAKEQSILAALEPIHHLRIAAGCRGGGCGVCKIQIQDGDVALGPFSAAHVNAEERAEGYALACKVFPRSNVTLRVVGKALTPPAFLDAACREGSR